MAATRPAAPTDPVVVTLPVDRGFISYNADDSLMFIEAGAFGAGKFSDVPDLQMYADYFGLIPEKLATGSFIAHGSVQKLIRSYDANNAGGLPVKVSEINACFLRPDG